MCVKPIDIAD